MWGYGQCMDNIKGIINELNSMFSMLIELLTNDSLLQTTTTSLPSLMSAIKATALTLCVMFFLIDFFTKSLHLQWVTWENVLMLFIKLMVAKVCVDNEELPVFWECREEIIESEIAHQLAAIKTNSKKTKRKERVNE